MLNTVVLTGLLALANLLPGRVDSCVTYKPKPGWPYLHGNFRDLPSSREGGQCKDQCIVIYGIKICVNDCHHETTGKPTAEGPTTEGPTTEMPTTIKGAQAGNVTTSKEPLMCDSEAKDYIGDD